ncbi:MAG: MnhB domain-containing protein [Halobacteriaceae archaeon]
MTLILRTTARFVIPLILTTSVALFVQGHNLPGGGFIGGTLAATAFALVYLAYGTDTLRSEVLDVGGAGVEDQTAVAAGRTAAQRRTAARFQTLFAAGLALAVGSGLAPLLVGEPFMSQAVAIVHGVPLYGEVELASALAFDLGVYLVVVGAVMTVLSEVGAE